MVRVRIAPSPTGDPHVGTAYIALFNSVLAQKHGGEFVLRIEDTDQSRSKRAWEEMIFDSLRWAGLEWHEGPDVGGPYGPYRQSERTDIYQQHCAQLIESKAAFRCFCTAERLDTMRAHQKENKLPQGYDGHCRDLSDAEIESKLKVNSPHVVRLRVERPGSTTFKDHLRGEITFEHTQVDDQILLKSDGFPTYHLANVVDDHLMKISHVMRAEEWISSTPKHVLLYRAFGWEMPTFIHMPLLRNADKSKISKRKNPVSLNYYRDAGILPEAMLNYLAMMGYSLGDDVEKFSVQELVDGFDLDRVSVGGPVFDLQKLSWLNGLYIRDLKVSEVVERLRNHLLSDERLTAVAELMHERMDSFQDFVGKADFFFNGDLNYDEATLKGMIPKKRSAKDASKILAAVATSLDALGELSVENIEEALKGVLSEMDLKSRDVFMPTRLAVTGTKASPPLYESMVVLGKERCRRRLRLASQILKAMPSPVS